MLEEERLVDSAGSVGRVLLERLRPLRDHESGLDVRGAGLFVGVEMAAAAGRGRQRLRLPTLVADQLRQSGVLVGVSGPDRNVVKIRPPLVFSLADAERLIAAMENVLDRAV